MINHFAAIPGLASGCMWFLCGCGWHLVWICNASACARFSFLFPVAFFFIYLQHFSELFFFFFFFWNVAALCCWPFFGRRLTPACISRFSGVQSPGAQVWVCVRSAVCELSCFFTLFHLFISVFSEVESSAIKNTILLAVTVWLERIFISSQVVCCDCPRRHDVYGFMSNLRPSNPNAF